MVMKIKVKMKPCLGTKGRFWGPRDPEGIRKYLKITRRGRRKRRIRRW